MLTASDRKERNKEKHRDLEGGAPLPKAALDEEEIVNGDSDHAVADERMKELEDNQVGEVREIQTDRHTHRQTMQ